MLGPVCVPQREDGIVREAVRRVDIVVEPPVPPVDVHIHRRVDHGMVKGGVEHGLLVLGAFRLEMPELVIPRLPRGSGYLLETAPRSLSLQIFQRSFRAHGRKGDLHGELPVLPHVEAEIRRHVTAGYLREVLLQAEPSPESVVRDSGAVLVSVSGHRTGE